VAALAGTVVVYAVDILFHPLPSGASELFQKFASGAIFFGAAILCARKARAPGGPSSAWWLLAVSMVLWGMGSAYYTVFLWDAAEVPIPSIADLFWILFYLPAYAGLYSLLKHHVGTFPRGAWLDALVGGLGVGGAAAALVFGAVLDNTGGSVVVVATNLAYPIGDFALLGLVAAAMTVTGWRTAGVWRWIAPAFALFAVADSVYFVQIADDSYAIGGLLDLGWPIAALLVAIAAWRPGALTAVAAAQRASARLGVPAACGLAALALLVFDHFDRTNLLALVLAAASIFLILVRLHLTAVENKRLLKTSQEEATSDSLTGLGNHRKLTSDLAAQIDELDPSRPLVLTLFDLDGFKLYNDTFGHVAGDRLLERLAARLDSAGPGTAYRMGGDEFCTLERVAEGEGAAAVTAKAAAALSEHGEGFSVGCSYGSVWLPDETTDPTDALRIADRRMYSKKGQGRASAAQQSADVLLSALAERDLELSVHIDGVANLACTTATRLGVSDADLETVRQTALLHDVGKVAIPDEILNKPGPLDEAEWAFMKRHTVIGERIISAAPALARVAAIVRSTHEYYDGTGYPDGLSGEDIPLVARIVAVSDAYDAMTTRRAYRGPLDGEAALHELRRCAGSQFDPEVVEAFATALDAARDPEHDLVEVVR
jgi:diguanylate cyclase (GGDEF)-like protein